MIFPNLVISTEEKSPQVTPQRESNLCRASCGDFSSVEMTYFGLFGSLQKFLNETIPHSQSYNEFY